MRRGVIGTLADQWFKRIAGMSPVIRVKRRLTIEDANGILFIHFPIVELAAALARSTMTVKRSLNELEDAGLILRVRQGLGEPNKIYVLIPKKEDSRL